SSEPAVPPLRLAQSRRWARDRFAAQRARSDATVAAVGAVRAWVRASASAVVRRRRPYRVALSEWAWEPLDSPPVVAESSARPHEPESAVRAAVRRAAAPVPASAIARRVWARRARA